MSRRGRVRRRRPGRPHRGVRRRVRDRLDESMAVRRQEVLRRRAAVDPWREVRRRRHRGAAWKRHLFLLLLGRRRRGGRRCVVLVLIVRRRRDLDDLAGRFFRRRRAILHVLHGIHPCARRARLGGACKPQRRTRRRGECLKARPRRMDAGQKIGRGRLAGATLNCCNWLAPVRQTRPQANARQRDPLSDASWTRRGYAQESLSSIADAIRRRRKAFCKNRVSRDPPALESDRSFGAAFGSLPSKGARCRLWLSAVERDHCLGARSHASEVVDTVKFRRQPCPARVPAARF